VKSHADEYSTIVLLSLSIVNSFYDYDDSDALWIHKLMMVYPECEKSKDVPRKYPIKIVTSLLFEETY
jgi:hypothetical protein